MSVRIAPPFLASEINGGEWSASRSGRFIPGERATGTHWIGGWVGPRAGVDTEVKKKIFCSYHESDPGIAARSLSLYQLSYSSPNPKKIRNRNYLL
jgi:hypothetical protein